MIIMHNGIAFIERSPYHGKEDEARWDKKYGPGKWQYSERVCSYVTESCGYGPKRDRNTCMWCDGKCVRPEISPEQSEANTKLANEIVDYFNQFPRTAPSIVDVLKSFNEED